MATESAELKKHVKQKTARPLIFRCYWKTQAHGFKRSRDGQYVPKNFHF